MKNYEEKYKEDLEAAKGWLTMAKENNNTIAIQILEKLFPELKESEDERIRKALIRLVNSNKELSFGIDNYHGIKWSDILAWLEKQGEKPSSVEETELNSISFLTELGYTCIPPMKENQMMDLWEYIKEWKYKFGRLPKDEDELASCIDYVIKRQKPIDKAEPKFKVGDWIIYNRNNSSREILYVYDIRDGRYYFNDNIHFSWPIKECDEKSHLWTIQDAKDGDILSTENFIFIFKNIDNGNGVHYYCHYEISKHEDDNQFGVALPQSLMGRVGNSITHYSPATKEQRDTLMKAMADARYVWDAEKKELNKIELNSWSEEDNKNLNSVKWIIENSENLNKVFETIGSPEYIKKYFIDWLKSLKPRWKPSNLQLEALESAYKQLPNIQYFLQSLYNDIKNL